MQERVPRHLVSSKDRLLLLIVWQWRMHLDTSIKRSSMLALRLNISACYMVSIKYKASSIIGKIDDSSERMLSAVG